MFSKGTFNQKKCFWRWWIYTKKFPQNPKIQNLERPNFLPGNILQIYVEAILCAFEAQARNDVGMA